MIRGDQRGLAENEMGDDQFQALDGAGKRADQIAEMEGGRADGLLEHGEHEIVLVDLKEYRVISRVSLAETFVGLAFSPDGSQLFASGAEKEVVHQFAHRGGFLTDHREIRIAKIEEKYVPAGLSVRENVPNPPDLKPAV